MAFIFIYDFEWHVLLNHQELPITVQDRLFCKGESPNEKDFVEVLSKLPRFEYSEQIVVLKILEGEEKKISFSQIESIIPINQKSYLAYQRNYRKDLAYKDPNDFSFEKMYQKYLEECLKTDARKSLKLFDEHFGLPDFQSYSDFEDELVKAKIDKKLFQKKVRDIEKGEYKYFFSVLFVFDEMPITRPLDFFEYVIACFNLYKTGAQRSISEIISVGKRSDKGVLSFLFKDSQKNAYMSFESLFNYMDKRGNRFNDFMNAFEDECSTMQLSGRSLNISVYVLYIRYLIQNGFSIRQVHEVFKHYLSGPNESEWFTALRMNVIYFPYAKIGNEFLPQINNLKVFKQESSSNYVDKLNDSDYVLPFLTNRLQDEERDRLKREEEEKEERKRKLEKQIKEDREAYDEKVSKLKATHKLDKKAKKIGTTGKKERVNYPLLGIDEIWKKKSKQDLKEEQKKKSSFDFPESSEASSEPSVPSDGTLDENDDILAKVYNLIIGKDLKLKFTESIYDDYKDEIAKQMQWGKTYPKDERFKSFKRMLKKEVLSRKKKLSQSSDWKNKLCQAINSKLEETKKKLDELSQEHWQEIDNQFKSNLTNLSKSTDSLQRQEEYKRIYKA